MIVYWRLEDSLQYLLDQCYHLIYFKVRKLLNSGTFYFSWQNPSSGASSVSSINMDLTLCAQRRNRTNTTDNRFFWYA